MVRKVVEQTNRQLEKEKAEYEAKVERTGKIIENIFKIAFAEKGTIFTYNVNIQ